MTKTILHGFAESGNAYKVALMLQLCEVAYGVQKVDFFAGASRTSDFREKLNDMGEIPVLQIDGLTLTQSGVILDYLARKTGHFGPRSDDEHRDILRWILFDNHKFTNNMATYRFLQRFFDQDTTEVERFLKGRTLGAYKIVDAHLKSNDFMVAGRPTIADISLCGYVYFDGETDIDIASFKGIDAWRHRIKALPNWAGPYDLMPRAFNATIV